MPFNNNKYRILVLFVLVLSSCNSNKVISNKSALKTLDFRQCLMENKGFEKISIRIPKRFTMSKTQNHGFCEYNFIYPDGTFLYVSTDIYSGSNLNSGNRMSVGIDTYAINRNLEPLDTIRNEGVQMDGDNWLEYILGGYVIGFGNVKNENIEKFTAVLETIELQ